MASQADAYDDYLRTELFPRVARELGTKGYRGFHVLRLEQEPEVKFVTMVWFDSIDAVRSFAGENYEIPVISPKAHTLLSRYADRVEHLELSASSWSGFERNERLPGR
jgi:hypothetical protein